MIPLPRHYNMGYHIELEHFKYLQTPAKFNFKKAANKLYIWQLGISRQIGLQFARKISKTETSKQKIEL